MLFWRTCFGITSWTVSLDDQSEMNLIKSAWGFCKPTLNPQLSYGWSISHKTGSWMRNSTKTLRLLTRKFRESFFHTWFAPIPVSQHLITLYKWADSKTMAPDSHTEKPRKTMRDRPLGYLPHLYKSTLQSKHSKPSYNFWECFTVVDIILDRIQTGKKIWKWMYFAGKQTDFENS